MASGLVQELTVESDLREQLVHAIQIFLFWNHQVTHYKTGVDAYGTPFLTMQWHGDAPAIPLMAPMTDASGIADQCYAWLKNAEYPEQPDHDGSNSQGWHITSRGHRIAKEGYSPRAPSFYNVFTIQPAWIEYHK